MKYLNNPQYGNKRRTRSPAGEGGHLAIAHLRNRAIAHKIHFKVDRPTGRPPELPDLQPLLQSELKSAAERPGGLTS